MLDFENEILSHATPDIEIAAPPAPEKEITLDEAIRLCNIIWGPKKRANLASPHLGNGPRGLTWHDRIIVAEEIIEDALRRSMTSPIQGERAQIGRRCAINDAIRDASHYAEFYSRVPYVSEGYLRAIAKAEEAALPPNSVDRRGKGFKAPAKCVEHVIPLAIFGSGTEIIGAPKLVSRIRRAILGPLCYVTPEEDAELSRLRRKSHERPNRPFLRYAGIITARRTDTGMMINPETFSFRDHLRVMECHPAFATAVPLFANANAVWRERLRQITALR